MIRKLLPVLLLLVGLGAGVGAGIFLKPAAEDHGEMADAGHGAEAVPGAEAGHGEDTGHGDTPSHYAPSSGPTETVRLPNQFVVPVIADGQVHAMVVIGLALELSVGNTFSLADNEPRLRAVLLQLLFDHANIGGFDGIFTSGEALLALRRTLREAARAELGDAVQDVLITDLLRQES
ncbi:flagellar basal body-associated FliL family protein [Pararhodobacter zhoushanensis]|uniref:Flagellar basal body-associated FliL family protein n=1 Tax=Pararhodobacter zhoushanensis TaxID=2479545 RepID=A0ABT3GTJ0_9RHOB|nr:flagellar basal body-associated FliL family protein [Pararhodobacter zhoushanensis]MCW1930829.1 flagellar basal body-associated FliL family protein [Pararhodobacter zhoushanensis]